MSIVFFSVKWNNFFMVIANEQKTVLVLLSRMIIRNFVWPQTSSCADSNLKEYESLKWISFIYSQLRAALAHYLNFLLKYTQMADLKRRFLLE